MRKFKRIILVTTSVAMLGFSAYCIASKEINASGYHILSASHHAWKINKPAGCPGIKFPVLIKPSLIPNIKNKILFNTHSLTQPYACSVVYRSLNGENCVVSIEYKLQNGGLQNVQLSAFSTNDSCQAALNSPNVIMRANNNHSNIEGKGSPSGTSKTLLKINKRYLGVFSQLQLSPAQTKVFYTGKPVYSLKIKQWVRLNPQTGHIQHYIGAADNQNLNQPLTPNSRAKKTNPQYTKQKKWAKTTDIKYLKPVIWNGKMVMVDTRTGLHYSINDALGFNKHENHSHAPSPYNLTQKEVNLLPLKMKNDVIYHWNSKTDKYYPI